MKTRKYAPALLLALMTACASSPDRSALFDRTDVNRDGYISLGEWQQAGHNDVSFLAADRDHRNRLNETEFYEAIRLDEQSRNVGEAQQRDNDRRITRAVVAALNYSNEVNGTSINVDTYRGTVQLSGAVRTVAEKQRAEAIARNVDGVQQVFNSITVRN